MILHSLLIFSPIFIEVLVYSTFETEVKIRPDDIDMNNHVHYSKYLDYLLAARYEQMKNNYKISMEEFIERGFAWVASTLHIDYKRGLTLTDTAIVKAQIESASGAQVKVNFWIVKKENNKVAAEGYGVFTMTNITNGRPARIPDDILDKYLI